MIPVVIEQCALKTDLALFDAGDQTEVGEKGITLRYVYSHIFNTEFHLPSTHQWWSKGNVVHISTLRRTFV